MPRVAHHLVVVAGDGQAGLAGQALPGSLKVQVVDSVGAAVGHVWVRFSASGGTVQPESLLSDFGGFAQTSWTLPFVVGAYTATATVLGLTPATFSAVVQNQTVSDTTQTVGTSGGTVALPVGTGLGTVQLRIPPMVLPSGSAVSLALQAVPAGALPAGRTALAPVVALSGPYVPSDSVISLRIPVAPAQGRTVTAYEIVDDLGTLRPVVVLSTDSASITLGIRALATPSSGSLAAQSQRARTAAARSYLVASSQPSTSSDVIDTGFRPGTDDWEFENWGSALTPRGQCIGQSYSMLWYYVERRLKLRRPTLNGTFSRTNGFNHGLDNRGWRLASVIQHEVLPWYRAVQEVYESASQSDEDTWNRLVDALRLTRQPIELSLRSSLKRAHSVVVWQVDPSSGTVLVADPNYPGHTNTIQYHPITKRFDPYTASEDAGEATEPYPQIYFMPIDRSDWDEIGERWAEFDAGTIGEGIFPSAPVTLTGVGVVHDFQVVSIGSADFSLQAPSGDLVTVWGLPNDVLGRGQAVTVAHRAASETYYLMTFDNSVPNKPRAIDFMELTVRAVPAVGSVSPDKGALAGGTTVTIAGVNFFNVSGVTIGGSPLANRNPVSPTQITGTTPASSTAGAKDVVVTTPGGSYTCAGCFTYVAPPTVSGIDPANGPLSGGTPVTITGTSFIGVTAVTIGGNSLGNRSVVSSTQITGTAPPSSTAGLTDVVVTTGSGSGTCTGCFQYYPRMTVQGVSPSGGPLAGGTPVTITGTGFFDVTAVTIGGVQVQNLSVVSSTQLTARAPAGASTGSKDLVVASSTQGSYTCSACFTYYLWAKIEGGYHHTCGIATAGETYCWGRGEEGQLGNGLLGAGYLETSPARVPGSQGFTALALGKKHTCGLASNGTAYCWGSNADGQLGIGTQRASATTPVAVLGGYAFVSLSAGWEHTCGLTNSGRAYCWGAGGLLGDGTTSRSYWPVPVSGGLTFVSMSAGAIVTCGVTAAGSAHCWGWNGEGALGDGTYTDSNIPVAVIGGIRFATLVVGGHITVGRSTTGALFDWGWGANRPVPVSSHGGNPALISLAAGWEHACGLAADGTVYCWGYNWSSSWYGQFGNGSTDGSTWPVAAASGRSFATLAAGDYHTCGVTGAGQGYCWGLNDHGQLGDGSITTRTTPVVVGGGSGLTSAGRVR